MRLQTSRLIIRSFTDKDVPAYAEIVADPEVTRYLGNGSPHSLSEATEYVRDVIRRDQATGISRYGVELKEEGNLIGFCGYKEIGSYTDFGWRYSRKAWGQGYGTEAALAVLDYGINTLGLTNILAKSYKENIGSLRIIKKLGFPTMERSNEGGKVVVRYYQR